MSDLLSQTEPDTRDAPAEPASPGPVPAGGDLHELQIDSVRWLATPLGARVLRSPRREWARPLELAVSPIKENPLRQIYRFTAAIEGGPTGCFIKAYNESTPEGRMKRLLRGPAARTEWKHTRHAELAGVSVPPLLAFGVGPGVSYLLTESCLPAEDLDDYLDRAGWNGALGAALARLLVSTHAAGVLHQDLHAGNVLCRRGDEAGEPRLWLLDLHKAMIPGRMRPRRLRRGAVIRNLAMMVAGLRGWAGDEQLARMLRMYLELGGARLVDATDEEAASAFLDAVSQAADRHAAGLLRSRDRSILRHNRYFAPLRVAGKWEGHVFLRRRRAVERSVASGLTFTEADWAKALSDPAALISPHVGPGEEVVKYSENGIVSRRLLQVGPHRIEVFVKHYAWRRRLAVVADLFRMSRARRTFKLGHQLLARDIPTALPLACLERRVGRLLIESILITEAIPESTHLERFTMVRLALLEEELRTRLRQSLARQIGSVIARMHEAGWVQRDMKAPNILVQLDPRTGENRIVFIDLDGVRPGRLDLFRPLVRLNDGLWGVVSLTRTDRLRVLKNYLGGQGDWKKSWEAVRRMTLNRRRARGDREGQAPALGRLPHTGP
ncbi:MAG: 3-deoxy-D-manno-octulosonic acid kinase [Phycisphaerae bacterium]|nr:3-deoxy-D-manno-octulosonic acid kinase [Phycisphaerae bacterium]